MDIVKTTKGFTFNKSGFKSSGIIRDLYKKKLNYPVSKQGEGMSESLRKRYITDDEFGSYLRLRRSLQLDPRYPNIYYKTTQSAERALLLAQELDSMGEDEFLKSGLPYMWQDDIGLSNIVFDSEKSLNFAGFTKAIKNTKILMPIVVMGLITLAFYWIQIRPTLIKKDCHKWVIDQPGEVDVTYKSGREEYNALFEFCLHEKGLK